MRACVCGATAMTGLAGPASALSEARACSPSIEPGKLRQFSRGQVGTGARDGIHLNHQLAYYTKVSQGSEDHARLTRSRDVLQQSLESLAAARSVAHESDLPRDGMVRVPVLGRQAGRQAGRVTHGHTMAHNLGLPVASATSKPNGQRPSPPCALYNSASGPMLHRLDCSAILCYAMPCRVPCHCLPGCPSVPPRPLACPAMPIPGPGPPCPRGLPRLSARRPGR